MTSSARGRRLVKTIASLCIPQSDENVTNLNLYASEHVTYLYIAISAWKYENRFIYLDIHMRKSQSIALSWVSLLSYFQWHKHHVKCPGFVVAKRHAYTCVSVWVISYKENTFLILDCIYIYSLIVSNLYCCKYITFPQISLCFLTGLALKSPSQSVLSMDGWRLSFADSQNPIGDNRLNNGQFVE